MGYDATNGLYARVEARKQTPTGPAMNVQIGPGDVISNIPIVLDFEHHQVHEGETHRAQDTQASLGTTTVKYAITVPVFASSIQGPHMVVSCDIYNGAAKVLIYESATFTGGSAVTAYNRNRNVATVPGTTIKTGVTSTNGTLIETFYVGAGTRTAGLARSMTEWVLKSNTVYRVDVVGLVANTESVVGFNFYEDLGV